MNDTAQRPLPLQFTASGSEYFRIWIVNLLLSLVTLGLYLPFAKARRLRYFYANTLVDGHSLGFHGDPWVMFRGHLVVMGFGLAYFLSGQFLPVATAVLALVFLVAWPLLWRSSLMFRLRNTSWRGLRFDFTGSKGGAYKVFLPWMGLIGGVILLGVAAGFGGAQPSGGLVVLLVIAFYALAFWLGALTLVWLKRYQHGGYRIAHQQGQLDLRTGSVLGLFLKAAGLTILGLIVFALVMGLSAGLGALASLFGDKPDAVSVGAVGVFTLALVVAFYAFILFLWGPYVGSRLQNLIWSGTRSQQLQFSSQLQARALFWLTLKNWVLIVLTIGLYRPFAVVATTRLKLAAVSITLDGDIDQWLADAQAAPGNAIGEMGGDFFGFDVGL